MTKKKKKKTHTVVIRHSFHFVPKRKRTENDQNPSAIRSHRPAGVRFPDERNIVAFADIWRWCPVRPQHVRPSTTSVHRRSALLVAYARVQQPYTRVCKCVYARFSDRVSANFRNNQ